MRHLTREDVRIHALLRTARSIAIVEPAPERGPRRAVLDYLRATGFDVIPVRADQAPVAGLTAFPRVAAIPGPVDLVLIVGGRGRETAVVDDAAAKGAEAVWMPPGRVSRALQERARERGLTLVTERDIVQDLRTWIRRAGKPAKAGVQASRRRAPGTADRERARRGGWAEAGGGGGVGGGGGRAVLDEKKMVPARPPRGRRPSRRGRAA